MPIWTLENIYLERANHCHAIFLCYGLNFSVLIHNSVQSVMLYAKYLNRFQNFLPILIKTGTFRLSPDDHYYWISTKMHFFCLLNKALKIQCLTYRCKLINRELII